MAKAYISEYEAVPILDGRLVPTGMEPALVEQVVTFTTTVQSAAFHARTKFIRVHVDAICSYEFGASPAATTNTPRMAASTTEFFGVAPGMKVAFVANT
ncbi:MAG TPA: hypothetical protein VJ396_09355 [Acidiferrobacterales bacterium]|nr:hypothetical protein [Acidiferrobacterales bacterium]